MERTRGESPEPRAPIPGAPPRIRGWATRELAPNQMLYQEGQLGDRAFLVQAGVIKLVTQLPNGRARVLGLHGPGAVLGLAAVMEPDASHHSHSAVTVGQVRVRWASAGFVRRLRHTDPRAYLELLENHCETLTTSERWITELAAGTTRARVARLIRYLSELQQLAETDQVDLLTCQDVGEIIGASTENTSRSLAALKRAGTLVHVEGRKERYRFDRPALEGVALD
ncbi:MAG: Crp/Fnr family transcriptional regulator [Pseudomonadota bacterium]